MTSPTTYIVIEVSEKENALDIMNILMTHTKARFTITKDIREYATERDKLCGTSQSEDRKQSVPGEKLVTPDIKHSAKPLPTGEESPDLEVIYPEPLNNFGNMVPKTEQELPPPEPYLQESFFEQQMRNFALTHNNNRSGEGSSLNATYHQPSSFGQRANTSMHHSSWQGDRDTASRYENERRITNKSKLHPSRKLSENQCAMCGAVIKAMGLDYTKRSNHAIVHTMLQRFKCQVAKCDYATRHRSNINSHMKAHHKDIREPIRAHDCLTPEEEEQLREVVVKCFPEMKGINVQKRGPRKRKAVNVSDETQEHESDYDDDIQEIVDDNF